MEISEKDKDADQTAEKEFEREWTRIQSEGIKDSGLRHEYEQKVHELKNLKEQLYRAGMPEGEMAKLLHGRRRELGRIYKEAAPPLLRDYIYYATAKKYGDPLGPDYEMLRQKKTDREIIESASRPIDNLDNRLTIDGFRQWFLEVYRKQP